MRAVIRLAGGRDAAAVAAIYAPFVDGNATSFEAEPPSAEEMGRRIAETTQTYPWLVCECDAAIAGYAYASWHRTRLAYRWSVETTVYVHPDYRRCGVARGLYTSLFAILAAQGFVHVLRQSHLAGRVPDFFLLRPWWISVAGHANKIEAGVELYLANQVR